MKAPLPTHCPNCDFDFKDQHFTYCPSCGQKRLSKLTVGVLFESLMSSFFSLDSRLYHTIIPFLLQPGKLAKDFIGGKRKSYMSPSQMYFFFSFVALLAASSLLAKNWDTKLTKFIDQMKVNSGGKISFNEKGLQFEMNENENNPVEDIDSIFTELKKDPMMQKQIESVEENMNRRDTILTLIEQGKSNEQIYYKMMKPENRNLPNRLMSYFGYNIERNKGKGFVVTLFAQLAIAFPLALIVFTLLLKLFYIRQKFTIAEHFVFSVYFFSFCFFLLTYHILAFYAFPNTSWILNLSLVIISIYFYKSIRKFYGQTRGKTILKFFLFTGISGFIMPAIIFTVIFLLSLIRYN